MKTYETLALQRRPTERRQTAQDQPNPFHLLRVARHPSTVGSSQRDPNTMLRWALSTVFLVGTRYTAHARDIGWRPAQETDGLIRPPQLRF
jgi:hypothetical protein